MGNKKAAAILQKTYWDSLEAMKLFKELQGEKTNECTNEEDDLVMAVIERRIGRLSKGIGMASGWKLVLDDFDQNDLCSAYNIFNVQLKCRYIAFAL